MKKTLAIILAILMIVTSVPLAFAAESGFAITHQPTVDELYVETNDANATYQWYEVEKDKVVDNTVATPYDPSNILGFRGETYYDTDSGVWVLSYTKPQDTYLMFLFTVPLKKI